MLEKGKPFYVAKPNNPILYSKAPLGHNSILKLMKCAGIRAGIPRNLTNHVVRKTSITALVQAGIPHGMVTQHSGHRSVNSIKHYAVASVGQQKVMSSILSHNAGTSDSVDGVRALPFPQPALPAAAGSSCDRIPQPVAAQPLPIMPMEAAATRSNPIMAGLSVESCEIMLSQLTPTQPYSQGEARAVVPLSQEHPFGCMDEPADPLAEMEALTISQDTRKEARMISMSGKREVGNVLKGMFSPNAYVKENTFNFTINFNAK